MQEDANRATNVEKDVEELRSEFTELKSDVSKLTDTLKKLYGDAASEGRGRARHEPADELEAYLAERVDPGLSGLLRRYPGRALGAALLLGVAAG
ncbi:MAG: hypothetical protein U5R46_18700 [Gammaproteobacteria bacterium]|nr:hypothetical protein [Gammaproteobacteria bacterium]